VQEIAVHEMINITEGGFHEKISSCYGNGNSSGLAAE
jgi:hypothetical protein